MAYVEREDLSGVIFASTEVTEDGPNGNLKSVGLIDFCGELGLHLHELLRQALGLCDLLIEPLVERCMGC